MGGSTKTTTKESQNVTKTPWGPAIPGLEGTLAGIDQVMPIGASINIPSIAVPDFSKDTKAAMDAIKARVAGGNPLQNIAEAGIGTAASGGLVGGSPAQAGLANMAAGGARNTGADPVASIAQNGYFDPGFAQQLASAYGLMNNDPSSGAYGAMATGGAFASPAAGGVANEASGANLFSNPALSLFAGLSANGANASPFADLLARTASGQAQAGDPGAVTMNTLAGGNLTGSDLASRGATSDWLTRMAGGTSPGASTYGTIASGDLTAGELASRDLAAGNIDRLFNTNVAGSEALNRVANGGGNAADPSSRSTLERTASGAYLDPNSNPGLQGVIDQNIKDLTRAVQSSFEGIGRGGGRSGAFDDTLAKNVSSMLNQTRYADYSRERQAQDAAGSALFGADTSRGISDADRAVGAASTLQSGGLQQLGLGSNAISDLLGSDLGARSLDASSRLGAAGGLANIDQTLGSGLDRLMSSDLGARSLDANTRLGAGTAASDAFYKGLGLGNDAASNLFGTDMSARSDAASNIGNLFANERGLQSDAARSLLGSDLSARQAGAGGQQAGYQFDRGAMDQAAQNLSGNAGQNAGARIDAAGLGASTQNADLSRRLDALGQLDSGYGRDIGTMMDAILAAPDIRQAGFNDANNVLGVGQLQDERNAANQQQLINSQLLAQTSPMDILSQRADILATLAGLGGTINTTGESMSKSKQSSGLGGMLGMGLSALSMFSDRRLKRDVVRLGVSLAGLPLYLFRYVWGNRQHVGVMADETERLFPSAVSLHPSGFKIVDYSKVRV